MEQQLLQAIDIASGGASQESQIFREAVTYLEQVNDNAEQVWSVAWQIFAARNAATSRPSHKLAQRTFCLTLVTRFIDEK